MPRSGAVVITKSIELSSPTGTVVAFAGTVAPTGWLMCDGSQISRTTYSSLYAAIGTSHGYGDNSTTFHLPDYRGRFLRGVDSVAGRDPDSATRVASNTGGNVGNAVGSIQGDQIASHNHYSNWSASGGIYQGGLDNAAVGWVASTATQNARNVSSTGGNENRPKNANVNYIIKI